MSVVRHSSTIEVARDRVFAYINDYENVPEYMFGIHKFTPRTDQTSGKGSVFDVAIKAGPKTLKSTIETIEWVENELIVLKAIEGFQANTTWRFADLADGGTTVDAEFEYILPGGLAGKALGAIMDPFAAQAIKHTDAKLRSALAG
ncbi:SRPBCC family protein [Gordonia sp. L191]|uniref:SRPBCC family protein n=1 Tax=Gordonia TaxID=2053 RepID=UPI001AD6CD2E|nr:MULTISPECIES: SRPBCC family protein [Gordonia]QTI68411.1 SRPBCC family protein [Gordonia polyisoprenivorans]WHU48089.1 SRPBCC family protein [Gordonia sp. L191]